MSHSENHPPFPLTQPPPPSTHTDTQSEADTTPQPTYCSPPVRGISPLSPSRPPHPALGSPAAALTPVPQSLPPSAGTPSTLTSTLALRQEWPSPTPSAHTNQGEGTTRDKHKDRHPQTPRRQTEGRRTCPGPAWMADTLLRLTIQPSQPDLQPKKPAAQKGLIPLESKPRPLHPGTPGKAELRLSHPGSGLQDFNRSPPPPFTPKRELLHQSHPLNSLWARVRRAPPRSSRNAGYKRDAWHEACDLQVDIERSKTPRPRRPIFPEHAFSQHPPTRRWGGSRTDPRGSHSFAVFFRHGGSY